MPSVAMKGGILSFAIRIPLTIPASVPVTRPARVPSSTGRCQSVMNTPVITAERVITVPMERSMPPVMMTKVTPSASTPLTVVASRIPTTLSNCRKFGDASENPTNSTISAPNASSRCMAPSWRNVRLAAAGRGSVCATGSVMRVLA